MNAFLLALSFFLICIPELAFALPLFFLLLGYLSIRLKKKRYLFAFIGLILLHFFQIVPSIPDKGEYEIIEIKNAYAIARQDRSQVLVYDIDELSFYDRIYVEEIEPIRSLNNLHLFSFQNYMNKKGIEYQAASYHTIASSTTLKAKMYRQMKEEADPFLFSACYGIYKEETVLTSLGLPCLTLIQSIASFVKKRWGVLTSLFVSILLALGYSTLFILPAMLVRWLLFQFGKLFFSDWKESLAFSLIGYLLIFPYGALDLCLVFPLIFTFLKMIDRSDWRHFIAFALQSLYFGKVDLVSLFFFSGLKKLYMFAFVYSWFRPIERIEPLPAFFSIPTSSSALTYCLFAMILFAFFFHKKKWVYPSVLLFSLCTLFSARFSPFFHVYMLDLGQADCTVIVEPFQKSAIMIDAGQNLYRDNVQEIILPFLRSIQLRSLDALIVTHDDFDHSGGVEALSEAIEIDRIVTDRKEELNVSYPFLSLLPEREAKEENDESIVSFFEYDGIAYLWMGDAGIEVEKRLLEQYDLSTIDVLKLGHHGSNTSSSLDFLDQLQPQMALISVGENNRYGHPHFEVLERLEQLHIDRLQTNEVGMVHIFSFHSFCFFECANGNFGRIETGRL